MMYDVEQLDHLSEFFKEKITESLGLGRCVRVENWKKKKDEDVRKQELRITGTRVSKK